jgi:hypothetical protein
MAHNRRSPKIAPIIIQGTIMSNSEEEMLITERAVINGLLVLVGELARKLTGEVPVIHLPSTEGDYIPFVLANMGDAFPISWLKPEAVEVARERFQALYDKRHCAQPEADRPLVTAQEES